MKKTFILLMTIFTFSNVTFASFPVVQSDGIEVVQSDDNSFAPNSYMTGILLGVFLGIGGVLIAYSRDDDEMVRGAWIGAIVAAIIAFAIIYYFAYIFEVPEWRY
ncbi:MAG: hypothetical protein ACKVG7_06605 [Flavobacteriales bacterium]